MLTEKALPLYRHAGENCEASLGQDLTYDKGNEVRLGK